MAQVLKILGQAAPLATTETDLYTVPAATTAAISSLVICNRGAATTIRVSVSAAGAVTATKDYIYYDVALPANETLIATVGITLAATDKVRVYAGTANTSFAVYGSENT